MTEDCHEHDCTLHSDTRVGAGRNLAGRGLRSNPACLHGDGAKMVHLTIAVDADGYRRTDRLWNVPLVRELYQTFEARPSATGTTFTFYYALRPRVPIPKGVAKSDILAVVRQHAEGDAQGLKEVCEAEVRAQGPEQR